jgi:hypothetical protein
MNRLAKKELITLPGLGRVINYRNNIISGGGLYGPSRKMPRSLYTENEVRTMYSR